jgi:hypothetical protein
MKRRGDARSGWVSVGVAIVASLVIVALVTAQTRGDQNRGGSGASLPTLSATRIPTPIALGDYLATHRGLTGRPFVSNRIAGQSGHIVTFKATNLELGAGDRCELRWTQLDKYRLRPTEESFWRYENILGWPDGLLSRPDGELWVPRPNPYVDVGWFFIRLQLLCADREVAWVDTDEFWVEPPSLALRAVGTPLP